MKICGACRQDLSQESFSKKQWQLKQQRRCKDCIVDNQDLQLTESQKKPTESAATEIQSRQPESECTTAGDEAPSCLICFGEGPDSAGRPLRRDCSCRGDDAGYCHLSCIVKYAEQKSQQWNGGDINQFRKPWEVCSSCNQSYTNELAVDLATEFVTFVKEIYPRDQLRNLEARVLRLESIQNMASRLQPKQRKVAKQIGRNILMLTKQIKLTQPSLSTRCLLAEAVTYNSLGRIALVDKTEESSRVAVISFEKCRAANKAIGNENGVALAETYIAIAKSKYEGGGSEYQEVVLDKIQKVYEQRLEKFGESNHFTLIAGAQKYRN